MSTKKNADIQQMVVATEVAVQDVISFLKAKKPKKERRGELEISKVKEEYIDLIEYVEDGLVTFDSDNHPTLTLRVPLYSEHKDDQMHQKTVSFRKRVKAADQTRVMNGVDTEKKKGDYVLKLIGFLCQLSNTDIEQLEKDDFDVINQICSVF